MFRSLLLLGLILPYGIWDTCLTAGVPRRIKHIDVDSIQLVVNNNSLRLPGNKFEFGIRVIDKNGMQYSTRGWLKGTLAWRDFSVNAVNGEIMNGQVMVPVTLDPALPSSIVIVARVTDRPELFTRIRIATHYKKDQELFAQNVFSKAPGSIIKLGVLLRYSNGDSLLITNSRAVNRHLERSEVLVMGGNYKAGRFYINTDLFSIQKHRVGLIAQSLSNGNLADTFEIQLDYRANYQYDGSGGFGSGGFSGSSGGGGSAGSNGNYGGDGDCGDPGEDGRELDVYLDAYWDGILNTELLKVMVTDPGTDMSKEYLVNPDGGSILIDASGGDGGTGGAGGMGGRGGNGQGGSIETITVYRQIYVTDTSGVTTTETITETHTVIGPGEDGGDGGDGGNGGDGGCGGNGGLVYIHCTAAAQPYLGCIRTEVRGGEGGPYGLAGFGGPGGSGGVGNPSGSSGSSGNSGSSGRYGWPGNPGDVSLVQEEFDLW